jgi:hypothetical protein
VQLDILELGSLQPLAELVHRLAHLARAELGQLKGDAGDGVVFVDQPAHEQRVARDRRGELGRFLVGDLGAFHDRVGLELRGKRGTQLGDTAWEAIGIAFDDVEEGVECVVLEIPLGVRQVLLFVEGIEIVQVV